MDMPQELVERVAALIKSGDRHRKFATCHRWRKFARASGSTGTATPLLAVGSRHAALAMAGDASLLRESDQINSLEELDELTGKLTNFTYHAERGPLYLWTAEADQLLRAMPDLPPHAVGEDLTPFPSMFFYREQWATMHYIGSGGEEREDIVCPWATVAAVPEQKLYEFITIGWKAKSGAPIARRLTLPFGAMYPSDCLLDFEGVTSERTGMNAELVTFVRMMYFIKSAVADIALERPSRTEGLLMKQRGGDWRDFEEDVSVVRLRRPSAPQSGSQPGADDVEWRHHWWVSGHWRAQWYPSRNAHDVIWVRPHIKGDTTKPLLNKVYVVER